MKRKRELSDLLLQARSACLSEHKLLDSFSFPQATKVCGTIPYFPWATEFSHFGEKWLLGVNGIKMWPGLLAGRSSAKADGHNGIKTKDCSKAFN